MDNIPKSGSPPPRLPRLDRLAEILTSINPGNHAVLTERERALADIQAVAGLPWADILVRLPYQCLLAQEAGERILVTDEEIPAEVEGSIYDFFLHVDPITGKRRVFVRLNSHGVTPALRWGQIVFFREEDVAVVESRTSDLLLVSASQPLHGGGRAGNHRPIGKIIGRRPRPDAGLPAAPVAGGGPDTLTDAAAASRVPDPDVSVVDGRAAGDGLGITASVFDPLGETDLTLDAGARLKGGTAVSSPSEDTEA